MRRIFLLNLLIFAYSYFVDAQENTVMQTFPTQWIEALAEDGIDIEQVEELDQLQQMLQNPLNLNVANQQLLEPFFFLSDIQIQNLLFYLDENGPMVTIYELQAVEGFNAQTIQLMLPFVTILPIEKVNPVKGFQLLRMKIPVVSRSESVQYVGSDQGVFARTLIESDRFKMGFSAEKDAGEPAFSSSIPVTDHLSAFWQQKLKADRGHWVVGDYRFSFGQGLALSLGANMLRSGNPVAVRMRQQVLSGYASSDEWRYLRGAAAQINIAKRLSAVPFISYKQIDASLTPDSTMIENILTSGYHRTPGELSRRHNINELMSGLTMVLNLSKLRLEGGSYYYRLSKPVAPASEPYQYYQFSGQELSNGWLAYTLALRKVMLFGETSFFDFKKGAFSQGLLWEPDNRLSLSVRYQYFALGYFAPYMAAGSRSSDPSGESNVYVGIVARPSRYVEINSYLMSYRFQWLHYQVDAPSTGNEGLVRLNLGAKQNFSQDIQIKFRRSEQNTPSDYDGQFSIVPVNQYNIRWQGVYSSSESWRFVTRFEYCHYNQQQVDEPSMGTMFFQDVCYRPVSNRWMLQCRFILFNTDDYNSRIYTYEPEVRYGYSVPALYGQGTRFIVASRYSGGRSWDFYLKFGLTQQSVNEGDVSRFADLKLQLIYNIWYKKSHPDRVAFD